MHTASQILWCVYYGIKHSKLSNLIKLHDIVIQNYYIQLKFSLESVMESLWCALSCFLFCFVGFFFNIYWAFLSLGCLWMHIFCFKTLWKSSQRTIIAKMSLNRHVPRLFLCHVCQMNFGLITRNPVCTHVYVLETGEEGGEGAREPFAQ